MSNLWTPDVNDLIVAPNGIDRYDSGTMQQPFATFSGAKAEMLRRRKLGLPFGPATVWFRGGTYKLSEPVIFTPEDAPNITYRAIPGEEVIFTGGSIVNNIRECTFRGKRCLEAYLPEVALNGKYYKSLFVNGRRAERTQLPKNDFFWLKEVPNIADKVSRGINPSLKEGSNLMIAKPEDLQPFTNLTDVEIHVYHYWVDEHMPVASLDPQTGVIVSTHRSAYSLTDDYTKSYAKYRIENTLEGLCDEGQWYLDRAAGILRYLPYPDETAENTILELPELEQLVIFRGDWENGRLIHGITFQELKFRCTEWAIYQSTVPNGLPHACSGQSCNGHPGSIHVTGATNFILRDCSIEHVGQHALCIDKGCSNVLISGNTLQDLGSGGICIDGGTATAPISSRTRAVTVSDNYISCGGRVWMAGCGILMQNACYVNIQHNDIQDFYYSGVSLGWVWGYADSVCHSIRCEKNHIRKIGQGVLSDMGGIYTLGMMPHSFIRGNLIHDIKKSNYGGWAIYNDEGSSNLVIENNICYDTSSNPYNCHYGCENAVRNNIFAKGREAQISLSRRESEISFRLERNIIVTQGKPVYHGGYGMTLDDPGFTSDLNVIWDMDGTALFNGERNGRREPMEQLRQLGVDQHSIYADPCFVDFEGDDYRLRPESPAFALGFRPIDMSDVGVRPAEKR